MKQLFCIVDAQNDFLNPDGALFVPEANKIKKTIGEVIKFARKRNVEVIFTQDDHDGSEPELIKNGGPFPPHCMNNTEGQRNIDEAKPIKGERVFTKQCYNVWDSNLGNKDIKDYIESNKFTEVYIGGVASDYCIKAAALGFKKLGLETYVFTDAIKGVAPETTEAAINEMKEAGVHFARFVI